MPHSYEFTTFRKFLVRIMLTLTRLCIALLRQRRSLCACFGQSASVENADRVQPRLSNIFDVINTASGDVNKAMVAESEDMHFIVGLA